MTLKSVFSNPKVMASSGFLAMVPKCIVTGVLSFSFVFFLGNSNFWAFCFVLYPIVGSIFDIALYFFRNSLWKNIPEPNSIPEDWNITSEQLLKFSKQIPKVRLMRFVGCLLVLPFMSFDKGWFLDIFSWMITGYFICVLFDGVWLKIFKLKRPEYIIKQNLSPETSRYLFNTMKDGDPSIAGTSAWIRKKSINS